MIAGSKSFSANSNVWVNLLLISIDSFFSLLFEYS